jgi:hypothetical protein
VATKRKGISKKTRFEVFKRDGFRCQYCGAHPPGVLLHVDHIKAVAAGGVNDMDNYVTACEPCNLGKGARDLSVVPQSLSDKAALVAEREEQLQGYSSILEAKRQRIEDETWRVLAVMFPGETSVPRKDHASVKMFIEKMGVHPVLDAADIAMSARVSRFKVFRYFCGICWNKVREAT